MPHHLLEVVPENPQVEHVAAEMHPPAVQEHRRDQRAPERQRDHRREVAGLRVLARHDAPGLNERLQRARWLTQLEEKCENVQDNKAQR